MATANRKWTLRQGDTFSRKLTWKSASGAPIDLTGYAARMQVRPAPGGSLIVELSTGNGRIVITALAGELQLTLAAADSALLAVGRYQFDLEVVSGPGAVTTLLAGDFEVQAQITV